MSKATDARNNDDFRDDDKDHDAKSPERLEREVDQARARVGRSASELSDRLSPGELIDQALGMAREHGGEFGRNLGARVKSNPMPMILTSVGISWMMMSSGGNGNGTGHVHRTYGAGADKPARSVKSTLGDAVTKSRDKAAAVGDGVHGTASKANESVRNARHDLVQFYRDQPLLAGSVGIAIGAALGALIPSTGIEDDLLGEASDRSVDAAGSTIVSKCEEVRESVRSE